MSLICWDEKPNTKTTYERRKTSIKLALNLNLNNIIIQGLIVATACCTKDKKISRTSDLHDDFVSLSYES